MFNVQLSSQCNYTVAQTPFWGEKILERIWSAQCVYHRSEVS